jgi:hypothetical protein
MSRRNATHQRLLFATLLALAPSAALGGPVKSDAMQTAPALTDDDGKTATDISGISCLPPAGGKFVCLVIDDQGRLAQAATIEGTQLRAGGKIKLLGKTAPPSIVGAVPDPKFDACSKGPDEFKDLDGEAVAHDGTFFYVVGSHGCTRTKNKFRASSFVLARIADADVTAAAAADSAAVNESAAVATTFRLSEALLLAPSVKGFFAHDLMTKIDGKTKNGLNIEGLAIAGGKLYAGLRAPVIARARAQGADIVDQAFLVAVDLAPLFDAQRPITETHVREIPLSLGAGRGIRDLAWLPDGRLLILSGPAQDNDAPYELHVKDDPRSDADSKRVAVLDDIPAGAKAEAMHVLGQNGKTLNLVVLFDGPDSGGPRRYGVDLQ